MRLHLLVMVQADYPGREDSLRHVDFRRTDKGEVRAIGVLGDARK